MSQWAYSSKMMDVFILCAKARIEGVREEIVDSSGAA